MPPNVSDEQIEELLDRLCGYTTQASRDGPDVTEVRSWLAPILEHAAQLQKEKEFWENLCNRRDDAINSHADDITLLQRRVKGLKAENARLKELADSYNEALGETNKAGYACMTVAQVVAAMADEINQLQEETAPVQMLLWCPECGKRHIDTGDFATKAHHTHACQHCGHCWRPAVGPTCGVQFLPGFIDNTEERS